MRIITHDDGRCLTLRLLGELDHAAAQEVMPGIEDAVEEYLPRRCVLDLSGLSFMDSSGIGVIIGRSRKMGYFGGEVYAEHLSGRILKIFKVSGLHTLIRTSVPKPQKEREGENHNA